MSPLTQLSPLADSLIDIWNRLIVNNFLQSIVITFWYIYNLWQLGNIVWFFKKNKKLGLLFFHTHILPIQIKKMQVFS